MDNGKYYLGAMLLKNMSQISVISDVLRKRMMENGISARELAAFTMKKEGANDVD